jgi:hypothetical protein
MMKLSNKTVALIAAVSCLFSGDSCTLINPDPCSGIVCQNGGTCTSGTCSCTSLFDGNRCQQGKDQVWELAFEDGGSASHYQWIKVQITGFTNSGTFNETSDSPGLWMYDASGTKCYRLKVGGTIVRDSPGDRWTFVDMRGNGCGMTTTGGNTVGTANANFPYATGLLNGRVTLTTQSSLGTASGEVKWTAIKK